MKKTDIRKTGMARLMELAFTKKLLISASALLAAASAVTSFFPYIAIYRIIRELALHMRDLSALDDTYIFSKNSRLL
jgi:ATP-binding cassette subfamily B protein